MDRVLENALRLKNILEVLSPLLERHGSVRLESVEKAKDCVFSCSGAIRKLEGILEKCKREAASDGFRERLRNFGRKALYPFRRETLQSLKDAVVDCQRILDTAINVLQM